MLGSLSRNVDHRRRFVDAHATPARSQNSPPSGDTCDVTKPTVAAGEERFESVTIDTDPPMRDRDHVIEYGGAGAHRVLLRQALGGEEFLRVTWHEHKDVFVFSHWTGDTCTTATPVRVSELGDLASMTVAAIGRRAALTEAAAPVWPAPDRAGISDPGLARPA